MSAQECSGVSGGVPNGTDDSAAVHIWRDDTPPLNGNPDASPVELETAPEVLRAPIEGLTDPFSISEGMAVTQSIEAPPRELAERALTMLSVLRKQQETTRLHRLYYMQLARKYGCSYADIGESLGMTESGARKFLDRADGQ